LSSGVPDRRILEHEMVPEHRVLSFEEAVVLLRRLGVKPWQLPQISLNDPVARLLNAKPGDILEIKRRSPTGGVHIAYRLVVAFERRA